jgi:hypothetical protein
MKQCGESRQQRQGKLTVVVLQGIGWNPKNCGKRGALRHRRPRKGTAWTGERRSHYYLIKKFIKSGVMAY